MKALSLKSWSVQREPTPSAPYFILVSGRQSGLIGWLLSVLRIDATTTLRVDSKGIVFHSGSLAGFATRYIPFPAVSAVVHGYHKPWFGAIVVALVVLAIGGALAAGVISAAFSPRLSMLGLPIGLVLGLGAGLIYYLLNTSMLVAITEHGGTSSSICFKRSVIEGVSVGEKQAEELARILEKVVRAGTKS
jgi:hypothetical protein